MERGEPCCACHGLQYPLSDLSAALQAGLSERGQRAVQERAKIYGETATPEGRYGAILKDGVVRFSLSHPLHTYQEIIDITRAAMRSSRGSSAAPAAKKAKVETKQ